MAKPYKRPLRLASAEFTEKKSRFIGSISPASSEEEALSFLHGIRASHREASHNVYAYRIYVGGICRHSDDGEPSGTAGMPLLDVFLKQDIYDFCCVATRYFGGVLLGAGGLVRAYARCAAAALEASGVGQMRELTLCSVTLAYSQYDAVRRLLKASGAEITSEDFGAEVSLRFSIISDTMPELAGSLTEQTAGAVILNIEGTVFGSTVM